MHPRNKYMQQPDFKKLALENEEFRKFVVQDITGRVKVNFKDPLALRSLTKCLLKTDFGLEIDIPENHLVPTVPQRLNYLLWVEDLLSILPTSVVHSLSHKLVDLGTGPCCIFPLLGSKELNWKFLASESNEEGYSYAKRNVEKNGLSDQIRVIKVDRDSTLLDLLKNEESCFDATMCNPPFFSDVKDANWESKARTKKRPPPNSCNTANEEEIIVDGGEVAFVKKMILDSKILKEKVRIYTSMLGKKNSLKEIKRYIREQKIPSFITTEFHQGKTMRWGIAWSFIPELSFQKVAKLTQAAPKKPTPISFFIPSNLTSVEYSLDAVAAKMVSLFDQLLFLYEIKKETTSQKVWDVQATNNTWSHQRRKRREKIKMKQDGIDTYTTEPLSLNGQCDRGKELNGFSEPENLKRKNIDQLQGSSKRVCFNEDREEIVNLLDCELTLKLVGINLCLELLAKPSMTSKEVLHQVLQFFKNKLS